MSKINEKRSKEIIDSKTRNWEIVDWNREKNYLG